MTYEESRGIRREFGFGDPQGPWMAKSPLLLLSKSAHATASFSHEHFKRENWAPSPKTALKRAKHVFLLNLSRIFPYTFHAPSLSKGKTDMEWYTIAPKTGFKTRKQKLPDNCFFQRLKSNIFPLRKSPLNAFGQKRNRLILKKTQGKTTCLASPGSRRRAETSFWNHMEFLGIPWKNE